jgi:uncharacterized protein (TIGR02271 family)
MTMQAEQLIGARVTGGDGQVVGTVQQVFNDDRDGTPVWARIRAGARERFVPLAGSKITKNGLSVPYDAKQIMSSPDIGADRHVSAAQTEQLRSYFGLSVPAQGGPPDADTQHRQGVQEEARPGQGHGGQGLQEEARPGQGGGQAVREESRRAQEQGGQAPQDEAQIGRGQPGQGIQDDAQAGRTQGGSAPQDETERDQDLGRQARPDDAMRDDAMRDDAMREDALRGGGQRGETWRGEAERGEAQAGEDWLIRAEERLSIGTETVETGRARLHKYVDVEPVEQAVHVFHEEYAIERVPIAAEEQIRGAIGEEGVQEIILHEERAVFRKEAVPVERVRLVVKRVGEDRTVRDEIRKERVEVEADGGREGQPAGQAQESQRQS